MVKQIKEEMFVSFTHFFNNAVFISFPSFFLYFQRVFDGFSIRNVENYDLTEFIISSISYSVSFFSLISVSTFLMDEIAVA